MRSSEATTHPCAFNPRGMATSNGEPLILVVIGQTTAHGGDAEVMLGKDDCPVLTSHLGARLRRQVDEHDVAALRRVDLHVVSVPAVNVEGEIVPMGLWVNRAEQLGHRDVWTPTTDEDLALRGDHVHGIVDAQVGTFEGRSTDPNGCAVAPSRNLGRMVGRIGHPSILAE